jgi:hypothetical protein
VKQVHCYNKETGVYLRSYPSLRVAGREYDVSPTSISFAASGRTISSAGYRWSFAKVQSINIPKYKVPYFSKRKPVMAIHQDTGVIIVYDSMKEAAKDMLTYHQNIRKAMRLKTTHLGYRWEYYIYGMIGKVHNAR